MERLQSDYYGFSISLLHQSDGWKFLVTKGEYSLYEDRPYASHSLALCAARGTLLKKIMQEKENALL